MWGLAIRWHSGTLQLCRAVRHLKADIAERQEAASGYPGDALPRQLTSSPCQCSHPSSHDSYLLRFVSVRHPRAPTPQTGSSELSERNSKLSETVGARRSLPLAANQIQGLGVDRLTSFRNHASLSFEFTVNALVQF